ncbi:hypothetical protein JB92DRAFT_367799 [Gautieria morchelliformis]|nr:hypothetical protein JB92DRAFT_367799 [Gautieria morchelliformis]
MKRTANLKSPPHVSEHRPTILPGPPHPSPFYLFALPSLPSSMHPLCTHSDTISHTFLHPTYHYICYIIDLLFTVEIEPQLDLYELSLDLDKDSP